MIIRAKVAKTPVEQENGLMFIDHLPEDEGMLFIFRSARTLGFWGKNTFIPLDIAFVDSNNVIINIEQINPHSLDSVLSKKSCIMALELNAGFFEKHNITPGDKLSIDLGDQWRDDALISFIKENNTVVQKNNERIAQEIVKPEEKVIGKPIDNDPQGQNQNVPVENQQELPIIDVADLGGILEDSFDETPEEPQLDQVDQEEKPVEDQQEEVPLEPQKKEYPVFSTSFEATEWAEKNNEVVRINYTTKHGRALIRDVEPHGKFHSESTSREILVTFDETVGDIRAFIVTNISAWAFTGKQFNKKFIVKA